MALFLGAAPFRYHVHETYCVAFESNELEAGLMPLVETQNSPEALKRLSEKNHIGPLAGGQQHVDEHGSMYCIENS